MTSEKQPNDSGSGSIFGAEAPGVQHYRRNLEAVCNNATVALFIMDERQHCVYMNPAAEKLTGYTIAEVQGRALHYFVHHTYPDGRPYPLEECPIDQALPQNNQEQGEEVFVHKDGSFYPVAFTASPIRENGAPVGTIIEVRDTAREKRAEQELRENERRYRFMAESIPQIIWTAEPDGSIDYYNQRWVEHTGLSLEETIGWGWRTLPHPDDLQPTLDAWMHAVANGTELRIEHRVRCKDGVYRWLLTRAVPLHDADGQIIKWFGTATDIDDQKRSDEERSLLLQQEQQARKEAETANRLKDEFLTTMSHELRTPLTAILGWANLLLSNRLGEEDSARALQTIERNARAQVRLIDDLLDVSRIITGKLRLDVSPVDLGPVVQAAMDAVRPAAQAKEIRLQMLIDPQAGPVSGDADRLQQVVWNLLSNAIKFTPKGGRVQARIERINSHIEITVSDTGQGIIEEFLPHVFDRFRQQDATSTREHGGLGLGLAIVRQLVEMHGGTVHAASDGPGQGTSFIVSLSVAVIHRAPQSRATDGPRVHPRAGGSIAFNCPPQLDGLKVLVVDDEADARALLKTLLEQCKALVMTAASAAEGLEAVGQWQPDVLVSDIGMPGEDGYALIAQVRALPPERGGRIPAVALTAYARVEDRMRVLSAGFQMHVPKPVEAAELLAIVASLAGWSGKISAQPPGTSF